MMNSLEIRDLTFTYPGAKTPTLNHVELKIEKGDLSQLLATMVAVNLRYAKQ